jgi:acid phosphatase
MMGYGNELSPVLGAPWIKTARHLLAGEVEDDRREGHDVEFKSKKGKKEKKPGDGLPEPSAPPNGTHSQL